MGGKETLIYRVELLTKVGKLKFYFKCFGSMEPSLGLIKFYASKDRVVLVRESPNKEPSHPASEGKALEEVVFSLTLPFEISIRTFDDNFKAPRKPLSSHRIITLGFKVGSEDAQSFDCVEDDLDESLRQIWDADFFQTVRSIVCSKCAFPLISPLHTENQRKVSRPSSPNKERKMDANKADISNFSNKVNKKDLEPPTHLNPKTVGDTMALDFSNLSLGEQEQADRICKVIPAFDQDTCKSEITNKAIDQPMFTRVRNLPNEGWEDLVDCWVCHSEDYTLRFSKLFCPTPQTLLVGTTHLLMNISRLASLSFSDNKLYCPACQSSLGELLADSQMASSLNIAATQKVGKIYKVAIGTIAKKANMESAPITRLPWSSTLLSDLIGKHRYQSASRFVLYGRETNLPRLILLVVNWDVYSWVNQVTTMEPPCQLSHSVYIQYLELTKSVETALIESWTLDDSVIPILYPETYIDEILARIVQFDVRSALHSKADAFKHGYILFPEVDESCRLVV